MTPKLSNRERSVVAAFALLGVATSVAMLGDLQVLAFRADEAAVSGLMDLMRSFMPG